METKLSYQLILASQSPRRKELLSSLNIPFQVVSANINEDSDLADPVEVVKELAHQKAVAVYEQLSEKGLSIVIGADTLVSLDDEILGKPTDLDEAALFLKKLAGRCHQVITGVALVTLNKVSVFAQTTDVYMRAYNEFLITDYISKNQVLDKAGGYGIQDDAISFVDKISGCYSNVVGLPVSRVISELYDLLDLSEDEDLKKCFIP